MPRRLTHVSAHQSTNCVAPAGVRELLTSPASIRHRVRLASTTYVTRSTCTFQVEPDTEGEWLAWFQGRSPAHSATVAEVAGEVSVGRRSRPGNRGAPTPGRWRHRSTSATTCIGAG